jgi:hypothetical protein
MATQTRQNRIKRTLAVSFIVTFATAAGCSVDTADQEPAPTDDVEEARGRTGKADLPGSCDVNQCGTKGSGLCWCDDKCSDYGDCCFNVNDVCETGNECVADNDCDNGFCGWEDDNTTRVCKDFAGQGDSCEGFVIPSARAHCGPGLQCIFTEPTHDVPGTCQWGPTVNPPPPPMCDATMICTQAFTCVANQRYPTGCGPANCDEPMGPCPTVNPPPPAPNNSCEDKCGGPADAMKSCFCDTACTSFGDCCDDYEGFCG